MDRKQYAVIGLGKFGTAVALTLAEAGRQVLAVDNLEERVQEVADEVTYAVRADVTDQHLFATLGLSNVDVAIIGISDHMEASILATIMAKDEGVPLVISKAMDRVHAMILKKVGADEVIFPEQGSGVRLAKNIMSGGFMDLFQLSSTFSIVEMEVPKRWVGKTIRQIDVRNRYQVNIIGVKTGDDVSVQVDPDKSIREDMSVIIIGENEDLATLKEMEGE